MLFPIIGWSDRGLLLKESYIIKSLTVLYII
jgi:hypothetical protein